MGWCHEFGDEIEPSCGHPMRAGHGSCGCEVCGTVCSGRFDGCGDVWARGPRDIVVVSLDRTAVADDLLDESMLDLRSSGEPVAQPMTTVGATHAARPAPAGAPPSSPLAVRSSDVARPAHALPVEAPSFAGVALPGEAAPILGLIESLLHATTAELERTALQTSALDRQLAEIESRLAGLATGVLDRLAFTVKASSAARPVEP